MKPAALNDKTITRLIRQNDMRKLCALMLYEVFENGAYTNLILKRSDEIASSEGISLRSLRAMLYGTVTYSYSIDFMVRHIAGRDLNGLDPYPRILIRLGAWQLLFSRSIPDFAAVSETVKVADECCPSAKGLVNAVLRKISSASEEEKDLSCYRPDVAVSLSNEIFGLIKRDYGKDRALSIGKAFLRQPKMTVRFDPARISAEELRLKLQSDSFQVYDGALLDSVLTIEAGHVSLENSLAFREGLFFVQNEAAALASVIASPHEGDRILDCCAAPGGKTTHMAELTHGNSDILALDSNPSRIELLKENLERLRIDNVRYAVCDCTDMSPIEETFDLVLADCPCSGLGIIGRKPDIRLNMSYDKIRSIIEVQHTILRQAASRVRPGGTLIYCTCTINKDENERQVERFLEENRDFRACSLMPYLPENIIMDENRRQDAGRGYITLLPDSDNLDGFFISRMERTV